MLIHYIKKYIALHYIILSFFSLAFFLNLLDKHVYSGFLEGDFLIFAMLGLSFLYVCLGALLSFENDKNKIQQYFLIVIMSAFFVLCIEFFLFKGVLIIYSLLLFCLGYLDFRRFWDGSRGK